MHTTYARDGVVFPIHVLKAPAQQQRFFAHFNKVEAQQPGGRFGAQVLNLHLTDPVIWELVHHPAVLQAAQNLAARHIDDLWIMSTTIFCKYPTDTNVSAVVGWHQDLTYWELRPQEAWTLWLALEDATVENGALVYATGRHADGQIQHVEYPEDETNVLMAKQSIPTAQIANATTRVAELKAGEAAWHGGWTPHMSPPNYSPRRRLGFVINFIGAGTELRPFSAKYEGHNEWRKPVLANSTAFPPVVVTEAQNSAHSVESSSRCPGGPVPLSLLRTTWGFDSWVYQPDTWADSLASIAEQGYAGVDADLSFVASIDGGRPWARLCALHGLRFVPTVATATSSAGIDSFDVNDHLASLRALANQAQRTNVSLLNVHGGHDGWDVPRAIAYLKGALQIESELNVSMAHETHRRRLFHSPWQTTAILDALPPDLSVRVQMTADLSHWVVVGSRFYDYPADAEPFEHAMGLLSERCVLVHARVGYSEGCQVPHPAAPEYRHALEAHEAWWGRLWKAQLARGRMPLAMPEFGPVPSEATTKVSAYMPRLPFTDQPVADVNEVNVWMAGRLQDVYPTLVREG